MARSKASQAARRGWETRKAEQARRSDAARRGWETRRQAREARKRETPRREAPQPKGKPEKLGPRQTGYKSEQARQADRRSANYKNHWQANKDSGAFANRSAFERERNRAFHTKSNAAHGRKAKFLERLGLRPAGANYKVGDTPKKKKK